MDPSFTLAPSALPPDSYFKQPSLIYYDDTPASLEPGRQVLAEVEACEVLRRHPHPNNITSPSVFAQKFNCGISNEILPLCRRRLYIVRSHTLSPVL